MHRHLHKMLFAAATALLLVFTATAPLAAATVESQPAREAIEPIERPTPITALSLGCAGGESDANGQVAACRWSTTEDARAYQLWRIVDRGDRELVGTFDNLTSIARDDVPNDAVLVRYAVIALDGDGEIIGQSRVQRVRFR